MSGAADSRTLTAFGGVVLLGGMNGIAAKQLLYDLEPFWTGVMRFTVAGTIMLAVVFASQLSLPRGRSLVGALIYGALGFAITFALVFAGLRDTPASTAAIFLALTPLLTMALAFVHRQESIKLQSVIGSVIAVAGVGLIFTDQLSAAVPLGSLVLIFLGVLALAETGIIVKMIPGSDPRATNAVAMPVAVVLLLGLSLATGETWSLPSEPVSWLAFAYIATLGSVVLFGLFVYVLGRWTASAVAYNDLLIPLVTILVATVLTGERPSPAFFIGGAVVVVGVFVGAFLSIPRRKTATTTLPECIPVETGQGATT